MYQWLLRLSEILFGSPADDVETSHNSRAVLVLPADSNLSTPVVSLEKILRAVILHTECEIETQPGDLVSLVVDESDRISQAGAVLRFVARRGKIMSCSSNLSASLMDEWIERFASLVGFDRSILDVDTAALQSYVEAVTLELGDGRDWLAWFLAPTIADFLTVATLKLIRSDTAVELPDALNSYCTRFDEALFSAPEPSLPASTDKSE